jgi:hypothetical protein
MSLNAGQSSVYSTEKKNPRRKPLDEIENDTLLLGLYGKMHKYDTINK